MSDFPTKTLSTIKSELLKQKQQLETNLKEIEEEDPAVSASLAESSEPGTDSYVADAHGKSIALEDSLKENLAAIKATLSRIDDGSYGKCANCGKQIEEDRLLAIPTAGLCLSCSKKKPTRV